MGFSASLALSDDVDSARLPIYRRARELLGDLGIPASHSFWQWAPGPIDLISMFDGCTGTKRRPAFDVIAAHLETGVMDTIHTYGNFGRCDVPFTRGHAETGLAVLESIGRTPKIWVNHGGPKNVQNIARPYALGDVPDAAEYHSDLLIDSGVRYVWDQRAGDVWGVDEILEPLTLRDGRTVWGFTRFNQLRLGAATEGIARDLHLPVFGSGGPDARLVTWYPNGLDLALSNAQLEDLVASGRKVIVTQHLGYAWDAPEGDAFAETGVRALNRLREWVDARKIALGTVLELLEFDRARRFATATLAATSQETLIEIDAIDDPIFGAEPARIEHVRGLAFHVEDDRPIQIQVGGEPVPDSLIERMKTGLGYTVGIRWWRG
jgi:hypothetical protein